jgi:hypothetical protein
MPDKWNNILDIFMARFLNFDRPTRSGVSMFIHKTTWPSRDPVAIEAAAVNITTTGYTTVARSRKTHCHIYVDVCATSMIFLYLYKYLFKGPGHARFTVHSLEQDIDGDRPRDEYQVFMNGRYLSSSEAIYRFFVSGNIPVWCVSLST